jgi:hypothetical protein
MEKKLQRIILGFHKYDHIWDCCDSTRIPIFAVDPHVFQLKLASGFNLYCVAVDIYVPKRFQKTGWGGLPSSWIIKADLIYNQTTRNRVKFRTTHMRDRSDVVFTALFKLLAKRTHTAYAGPTIAKLRKGKRHHAKVEHV